MTDTFLSYEKIQALTHRKVHSAQVRVLKAMGIEHRVEANLRDLMAYLPMALAFNELEAWAKVYTEGYMLKLRAMR